MRISDWSSDVCSSDLYQFHHLLPDFTAAENVLLPQLVRDTDPADAGLRAKQLLAGLGLGHRLDHRPSQLSGGEQQRVAVARAPANRPVLALADQPTGHLADHTADAVRTAFLRLVRAPTSPAPLPTHSTEAQPQRKGLVRDRY